MYGSFPDNSLYSVNFSSFLKYILFLARGHISSKKRSIWQNGIMKGRERKTEDEEKEEIEMINHQHILFPVYTLPCKIFRVAS